MQFGGPPKFHLKSKVATVVQKSYVPIVPISGLAVPNHSHSCLGHFSSGLLHGIALEGHLEAIVGPECNGTSNSEYTTIPHGTVMFCELH